MSRRVALCSVVASAALLSPAAAHAQSPPPPPPAPPTYAVTPPPDAEALAPSPASSGQTGWFAGQRGFSFKLGLGTAYRRLYSVPIGAADIDLAFGAQTRSGGWYGAVGMLLGSTAEGLATTQIHLGPSWEAPIGPVHLGVSPEASLLIVSRASADSRMGSATLGGAAFTTVDVVSGESYALTLGFKATVDALTDGDGPMWGGTASLGLRTF